jgi:hypothetical protein
MDTSKLSDALPRVPATQRFVRLARLVRGLSGLTQVGLMLALLVMWKQYHVPFVTAFERCFVAGVIVYVTLGTVASILMSLARIQPIQMLMRQVVAVASFLIFGALHYIYHMGIFQSVGAWALIYFGARVLVGRIESRATRRFRFNP